jgi:peptidoglycan/xylan/chitin deacetylase (PgdA/CDA1 family)
MLSILQSLFPAIIVSGPATRPQIALTFDDGPHPLYTPEILQILKKFDMFATFFMTGANISAHRDIVKRLAGEGHEIGNHTFAHPRSVFCGKRTLTQEIESTTALIEKITGHKPTVFRPPYGLVTPATLAICRRFNLSTILWSTNTRDYAGYAAQRIADRAINGLHPGAILLFHERHFRDSSRSYAATIQALEILAPVIVNRAIKAVTVSQLLRQAGV